MLPLFSFKYNFNFCITFLSYLRIISIRFVYIHDPYFLFVCGGRAVKETYILIFFKCFVDRASQYNYLSN